MYTKLYDVLNGKEDNYLLPFYWQRGDHTHLIPEQIQRIYDSGCRALCVESRPHPDFVGEGWWRDMDIILAEAEKRGMKVWILDDDKFPTGHAAGMIAKKHPELRQWELIEHHVDVVGPSSDTSLIVDENDDENILLGAYAYRRRADDLESCEENTVIELTDKINAGYLTWDIPDGVWRVFFYYKSRRGGRPEYIDMINPDSVKVLIDAVYESHWEHYSEYFGKTLVGFFSDEPCFGNQVFGKQRFDFGFYEARVGKHALALPWSENVLDLMTKALGYDPLPHLNMLWYEDGENGDVQAEIRHAYMDAITHLYSICFNKQLADWCHAHKVEYIGHIIEDENCHMRGGAGHYFRALQWQDMSGIDVVLHQIMPGMADYVHTSTCGQGVSSGGFFEYNLAKLGASLAHMTPHMEGKAMCEIFGAYGYGEDSSLMKFLMDHMLVRGINRFVPHAFSSKFPDRDCPPHFGAEGKDPSFEAFSALMKYTNKACHLLEGTVHKANAAVLYHVDGEWASRFCNASTMTPILTRLYDAHIDYDILPLDILRESASISEGKLAVNNELFDCLIVPYADHMPRSMLKILENLKNTDLPVWFVHSLPENATFDAEVIDEDDIVARMRSLGMVDVAVEDGFPKLRIYHCTRDDTHIFMFFNEDYKKTAATTVTLPCIGDYARLDILTDLYSSGSTEDGTIELNLLPGQSEIVIFGDKAGLPCKPVLSDTVSLEPDFLLELAECDDLTGYESCGRYASFFNINARDFKPGFSGKMRYTFKFNAEKRNGRVFIDLGRVGQNAEITLNGVPCGIRISAPYLYEITDAVGDGENEAVVVVSNTLAGKARDRFSKYLQLAPSGMLGGVCLKYTK